MTNLSERSVAYNDTGTGAVAENYTATSRPRWSPTQAVVLVIGLAFAVVGGVALARAGVNFSNVAATRSVVAGLGFTSMSAAIVLVVGVLLAGSCAHPYPARSAGWFFGVGLIAFGLVVLLAPTAFSYMWGFTATSGVVLTVAGAVLLVAAAAFPVLSSRSAVVRRSRSVPAPEK